MPEGQITRSDIESLARKIESPDPRLSEDEIAMLSTILSAAAEAVGDPASGKGRGVTRRVLTAGLAALLLAGPFAAAGAGAAFHDQFATSFTPGAIIDPGGGEPTIKIHEPH